MTNDPRIAAMQAAVSMPLDSAETADQATRRVFDLADRWLAWYRKTEDLFRDIPDVRINVAGIDDIAARQPCDAYLEPDWYRDLPLRDTHRARSTRRSTASTVPACR